MNEYKITYIAPPVSEIPKIIYIDAGSEELAINVLKGRVDVDEIISIELY